MLLAEALAERAALKDKANNLLARAMTQARVEEGSKPEEDPAALLTAWRETQEAHTRLVTRINLTNANIVLTMPDGEKVSMTAALARRDQYKAMAHGFSRIAEAAVEKGGWMRRAAEIKTFAAVDVAQLRADADRAAQEYNKLDVLIQKTNWEADLL